MRLLELDLRAFGPFTGRKLDFSPSPEALHVIYGPNEAGKSTALRAVRGLLYGIPVRTGDAHLHAPNNLRIGAVLGGPSNARLEVVRRKGLRNTLLDADNNPVDEALLARLCGGVTEAVFATMFGLDHETLRDGGQALLEGGGEIGQSLFGAALGGRGLHRVLRELREETEALFTPQAQKRPLNEALRQYAEAVRNAQEPTTAEAWRNQKAAIEADTATIEERRVALRALRDDERRLLRMKAVLPALVERALLVARREALGEVVRLPAEAGHERKEAQRQRDDADALVRRFAEELAAREAERARLVVPEAMPPRAELDARLGELDRLRALHDKVVSELPRVRGELARTEAGARTVLRRVGARALAGLLGRGEPSDDSRRRGAGGAAAHGEASADSAGAHGEASPSPAAAVVDIDTLRLADLERARPDSALQARVRRLAASHAVATARHARVAAELQTRGARLEAMRRRAASLPAPRDGSALALAVSGAERQGDLDAHDKAASATASRLERTARAEVQALGFSPSTSVDAAAAAGVPTRESIRRAEQQLAELHAAEQRHVEAARLGAERRKSLAVEIDALQRGQAVPTETDLDAARTRRERAWAGIKAALGGGKGRSKRRGAAPPEQTTLPVDDASPAALEAPLPNLGEYEGAVRAADELADRLRREATRVSTLARLLADRDETARDAAALDGQREELARRRGEAEAAWAQRWSGTGVLAPPVGEAAAWLGRHARLADTAAQLAAANAESRRLASALADRRQALGSALEALAPRSCPPGEDLGALLDAARRLLTEVEGVTRARVDAERDLGKLGEEIEELERELSEAELALSAWRKEWAEAAGALGLPRDAAPEEATATLQELTELFPLVDEARGLERRTAEMEATWASYAEIIRRLVDVHAPDLRALAESPEGAGAAARELSSRWHRAKTDAVKAEQLDRQIEDKRALWRDARERSDRARVRIAALLEAAGTTDERELVRLEQRATDAAALEQALEKNDDELRAVAPGFTLEALLAETEGLDADAVAAELEELEARIEECDRAREQAQRSLGGNEAGLKELETRSRTADAAAHAEQCLARVRELAERWTRLRLAGAVLTRVMESYRQKNQGPVLARASALFAQLTLGSFEALRAGYGEDDRAVLRCVRAGAGADGADVGVDALSDGTRDQLYLALRIASLERHALLAGDAMPLVVDDILVHFDDDRARASLAALGELAQKTQVLFFTHHHRLVELAREAVPAGRLVEHRLDRS